MKIVGATEYAVVLYRNKLPKSNNNEKMIFNWFNWEKDGTDIPKIHPTQKPVELLERLIEIFTDEGEVVIDPCAGSGSTLIAAENKGRKSYGFEIKKDFFKESTRLLNQNKIKKDELKSVGYSKTEFQKINPILF